MNQYQAMSEALERWGGQAQISTKVFVRDGRRAYQYDVGRWFDNQDRFFGGGSTWEEAFANYDRAVNLTDEEVEIYARVHGAAGRIYAQKVREQKAAPMSIWDLRRMAEEKEKTPREQLIDTLTDGGMKPEYAEQMVKEEGRP